MAKPDTDFMQRRERLSDHDKVTMLATFTRHDDLFKSAAERTAAELFSSDDRHFQLYWDVLRDYVTKHQEMPRKAPLVSSIQLQVEGNDEIDDEQIEQLNKIVSVAFGSKKSDLPPTIASTYLRSLLEEALLRELRRKLASDDAPVDVAGVLAAAKDQADAIGAVDSADIEAPFAGDWRPQAVKKTSTGLPFVDLYLGGGDVDGEVYGLLGPVGSCKTTLAVQLSTLGASRDYAEWLASAKKAPLKVSYHFNYEGPIDVIKMRALCCTALIDKDILAMEDFEQILERNANKFRPYELDLLRSSVTTGSLLPERKRYERAKVQLNRNWRCVDMSGNDSRFPGRGTGMISEIVAIIRRDLARIREDRGVETQCGVVVVDYVSLACERATMANAARTEDPDRAMRRAIGRYVSTSKNELATALNARVWLMQQLNGDANSLVPGRLPKRTDSKDNRMFAENLDFCFMIGNPDQNNMVAFGTDKQRRERRRPPEVVHILGNLNTVQQAKGYMIDPTTNRFVRTTDRERLADTAIPTVRKTSSTGFDRQLLGNN
jgi:tRNA isopentenyl-2-thiomethyl-A-37 hydroxylase MiaE